MLFECDDDLSRRIQTVWTDGSCHLYTQAKPSHIEQLNCASIIKLIEWHTSEVSATAVPHFPTLTCWLTIQERHKLPSIFHPTRYRWTIPVPTETFVPVKRGWRISGSRSAPCTGTIDGIGVHNLSTLAIKTGYLQKTSSLYAHTVSRKISDCNSNNWEEGPHRGVEQPVLFLECVSGVCEIRNSSVVRGQKDQSNWTSN